MTVWLRLSVLVGALAACVPSFDDRPWRVEEVRILAIAVTPAEARPGEVVTFDALVADPDGVRTDPVVWNYCARPRTAGERGGVTDRCARGQSLEPVANPGALLPDACARFGPNTPPAEGDAPQQRPADPDPSGGYYLPVRAHVGDAPSTGDATLAFGFARVRCDLVGVTRAVFDDFEARYRANTNPVVQSVLSGANAVTDRPLAVDRGAVVPLAVDVTADSFEDYVVYVATEGALQAQTETLRVRWYVTDGELSAGEVRASAASVRASEVMWTAPDRAGEVNAWVIIADDRGGLGWLSFTILVGG